jgi:hypothetical protein
MIYNMNELLKIHANGQWELVKAKPLTPEELKAFKERREAWLRREHGMKPATEEDKKLPPKDEVFHGTGRTVGAKDSSFEAARKVKEMEEEDKKRVTEAQAGRPKFQGDATKTPLTQKRADAIKAREAAEVTAVPKKKAS